MQTGLQSWLTESTNNLLFFQLIFHWDGEVRKYSWGQNGLHAPKLHVHKIQMDDISTDIYFFTSFFARYKLQALSCLPLTFQLSLFLSAISISSISLSVSSKLIAKIFERYGSACTAIRGTHQRRRR